MAAGDSNYQGGSEVVLTNFYNTLRQDQYRREQQDALKQQTLQKQKVETSKALDELSGKINPNGLRNPAELKMFYDKWDKFKEYKAAANNSSTDMDRILNADKARQAYQDANIFVEGAKEYGKFDYNTATKFQTDPESHGGVEGEQFKKYKANLDKPYTELGRPDPTQYTVLMKPDEADKKVNDLFKGLLEAQGYLSTKKSMSLAGRDGEMLYQNRHVAPQLAYDELLNLFKNNKQVRETYQRSNPNLTPEQIVTNVVKDKFTKLVDNNTGSFQAEKEAPQATAAELKQQAALGLRTNNVTNIVDKKNQSTLEEFKASLPAGATVQWVLKDGLNSQKIKAEGRNARPDEIKGIHIIVPAGVDKGFTPFPKIDDTIDFSKGDPKKSLNSYYNKFVGKNIENEDLGASGVKGNTSKAKSTTLNSNDLGYQKFIKDNGYSNQLGSDGNGVDYDLKAYYKKYGKANKSNNGHLNDEFKKPNHMTFSSESKYSKSGQEGGKWKENNDKTWTFYASKYNISQHSPEELKSYFKKYETGNKLVLPNNSQSTKASTVGILD